MTWRDKAACIGNPDMFFFTHGVSDAERRKARATCWGCAVRRECLDYAIEHQMQFGLWGGLTIRERRRYARTA